MVIKGHHGKDFASRPLLDVWLWDVIIAVDSVVLSCSLAFTGFLFFLFMNFEILWSMASSTHSHLSVLSLVPPLSYSSGFLSFSRG